MIDTAFALPHNEQGQGQFKFIITCSSANTTDTSSNTPNTTIYCPVLLPITIPPYYIIRISSTTTDTDSTEAEYTHLLNNYTYSLNNKPITNELIKNELRKTVLEAIKAVAERKNRKLRIIVI